jgi:hypothetical protein
MPQSERYSGGQAVIERRIAGLCGRVVREAQDVAAADAGQPAGAGYQQREEGVYVSDREETSSWKIGLRLCASTLSCCPTVATVVPSQMDIDGKLRLQIGRISP